MSNDDKPEPDKVESADDVEPADGVEIDKAAQRTGKLTWRRIGVMPVVLVLLLVVSGGLAAWLYFSQYRPDEQTDAKTAEAATTAAQDGMTALLSYKSETLDQDVTAAKSHLTGQFLNEYEKRIREVVAPAIKGKNVETAVRVLGAGVSDLHPDSAVVLVFIDESTISKDRPDPVMAASSVLVSLTKVQDKWLITKFDPV